MKAVDICIWMRNAAIKLENSGGNLWHTFLMYGLIMNREIYYVVVAWSQSAVFHRINVSWMLLVLGKCEKAWEKPLKFRCASINISKKDFQCKIEQNYAMV